MSFTDVTQANRTWHQIPLPGGDHGHCFEHGAVIWSATYEAFGNAHIDTEMVVNNLRFPEQYFDAETGLHYNFQRYYEPVTGRYVCADPMGFDAEDVNCYGYDRNVWGISDISVVFQSLSAYF